MKETKGKEREKGRESNAGAGRAEKEKQHVESRPAVSRERNFHRTQTAHGEYRPGGGTAVAKVWEDYDGARGKKKEKGTGHLCDHYYPGTLNPCHS